MTWQSCQAVKTTLCLTKKAFRAYLVIRVHAVGVCNTTNAFLVLEFGSQNKEMTTPKLFTIKCAQVISNQSSWLALFHSYHLSLLFAFAAQPETMDSQTSRGTAVYQVDKQ